MNKKIELKEKHYYILFVLLILLAAVIYYPLISTNIINYDSAYQYALNRHTFNEMWALLLEDFSPPLFTLYEKLFVTVFGQTLLVMRFAQIVLLAGMIFLALFPIRKIWGEKTSLVCAVFFIVTNINYMLLMEIRPTYMAYCLMTWVFVLAYYIFFKNSNAKYIAVFTAFVILAMYTHNFSMMGCIAIYFVLLVFSLLKKDKEKFIKFLVSGIIAAIVYVPWLMVVLKQYSNVKNHFWIGNDTGFFDFATNSCLLSLNNNIFLFPILFLVILVLGFSVLFTIYKEKNKSIKEKLLDSERACKVAFVLLAFILSAETVPFFSLIAYPLGTRRYYFVFSGIFIILLSFLFTKTRIKWVALLFSLFLICNGVTASISTAENIRKETFTKMIEKIENDNPDMNKVSFLHGHEWSLGEFIYYFPNAKHYVYDDTWTVLKSYDVFDTNVINIGDVNNISRYEDSFYFIGEYPYEDQKSIEIEELLNNKEYRVRKIGHYKEKFTYLEDWHLFYAEKIEK